VALAFALARLISSFLFGVRAWDPLVFITIPLLLSAVAFVAVWRPATRASRVDPMTALRAE
jgi:putative ABC transport system permease protein